MCEDGREYYAQSVEFDRRKASEWVKDNVLKHLLMCPWADVTHEIAGLYRTDRAYHNSQGGQCVDQYRGLVHNCPWRSRFQLRRDLQYFFHQNEANELWGWCAGYDWVAFCQLFGTMMDLPKNLPHYIKDFQYVLDERGITDSDLPGQEEGLHNALVDAHHLKRLWGYIMRNDAWQ